MQFLYFLEKLRVPGLNEGMLLITRMGEELLFLAVVLVFFWCVSKRRAYYILAVGFLGTMANQFLKLFCRIPRPWVLDPNFTILEQARAAATGYSFPSGHSQTAVGIYGAIGLTTNRRWLRWVCLALMVLVPFSRMYLGVHTPKDVLVGAGMALILLAALYPMSKEEDSRLLKWLFPLMIGAGIAFLAFVEGYDFPADVDKANLAHGIKNAYTLLGAVCGMTVVWLLDRKYLRFPVEAVWWAQILKVLLGLLLVLVVKAGLKAPLNALFGGHPAADSLRYFLVVLTAGSLWPMTFHRFSRLGRRDRS